MNDALFIAHMVRNWACRVLPEEPAVADAAVMVAIRAYAGGASISEACDEGRKFMGSWARHPSHCRLRFDRSDASLPFAS